MTRVTTAMVKTLQKTVTASNRRLLLAIAIGLIACWLVIPRADAHAAYESSTPAFAEQLSRSPDRITIRFTQELFRREGANTMKLARITSSDLLDEYAIGEVEISNDDRRVMSASVPVELPPGGYGVLWTNLSAEDGDEDSGWLTFYVQWEPRPWQIEQDRHIAQELLIPYPGDEPDQPETADAPTPATPAVARVADDPTPALGVGPLIWLALGVVASLTVVGALGYHLGRRGRCA
ncbi:MAG: hypothetical protein F4W96_12160 [Chloroflexi bacterium]|nr:hypothetical protein [Chloroflexota bacterium]